MNKEQIKEFLYSHPGYLKKSPYKIAERLEIENIQLCQEALVEVKNNKKGEYERTLLSSENPDYYQTDYIITVYPPVRKIKRLFYDIETSYNIVKAWRCGFNLNVNACDIIHERAIICLSYKWEGEDKVHTITWKKGNDERVVRQFIELMNEADELVGHNIEKFDNKWIMTRAIKHDIPVLPKYNSYDTLKKARAKFNFNSNKLDYIANFLGLGGKYKHPGMTMWDDIILRNDKKALKEMITYCEKDVALTEEVFNKLRTYTEMNIHHGMLNTGLKCSCSNCGSESSKLVKTSVSKVGTLKRLMECLDCNQKYHISNTEYLKLIK